MRQAVDALGGGILRREVSRPIALPLVQPRAQVGRDPGREAALFLDRCLRRLAVHESRCRKLLGELVAVLRRRQAFFGLGFVRLPDYARERLGISGSEAETAARVASGLRRLPAIARAFDAGEISFTKARILVRVASDGSEERWLAVARRETVRGLERRVEEAIREEDGAETTPGVAAPFAAARELSAIREEDGAEVDGEPRVRFRISCPGWAWLFFRRAVDLARRMAGADVPVWQAVEAFSAEALAAVPCAPSPADDFALEVLAGSAARCRTRGTSTGFGPAHDAVEQDSSAAAGGADEAPLEPSGDVAAWLGMERPELAGIVPADLAPLGSGADEADPVDLDRRLREIVRELRRIDWRTGRLLALLFARRLERHVGFGSEEDYIRGRLGIAVRKARQLLALDRLAREVPRFGEAYRAGCISWVRAAVLRPVLIGADPAQARAWLERAGQVTVRRLSDEVGWALERRMARSAADRERRPDRGPAGLETPPPGSVLEPEPLGAPLEPEPLEVPLDVRGDGVQMRAEAVIEFAGPASVVATFRRLVVAWSEPGEPPWKGLVRLLAHVVSAWRAPWRPFGRILSRDGYRCLVPACGSRRNLQVHHFLFRSAGGGDDEGNLGTLCQGHHLHGIHGGRVRASGRAPDALVWELGVGLRPGGDPFLRLRGDVYLRDGATAAGL